MPIRISAGRSSGSPSRSSWRPSTPPRSGSRGSGPEGSALAWLGRLAREGHDERCRDPGIDGVVAGRAGRVSEDQVTAHRPAELPRDVEPEAGAFDRAPLRSFEAFEQATHRFRGDPGPAVLDLEADPALDRVRLDGRPDRRAPAVLQGVVEEGPQDLVQLVRIRNGQPSLRAIVEL